MAASDTEQRKLAAIMFTDMVGYSALAQKNEALALALLEEHRRLVRSIFPKHQGQEIKTTGDGFLAEFASALAAVQSAVEIQRALAERNKTQTPERQVRIRIGIHVGDLVRKEGDVFGDGVNIAARIEPLAEPGGICLTQQVFDQVHNKVEVPIVRLGQGDLKNIQAPVNIYRIVLPWERPHYAFSSHLAFRLRQKRTRAFAAVLLSIVALSALYFGLPKRASLDPHRIAVLPFANFNPEEANEYLADQMTEELTSRLSSIGGLKVIARTSVMKYKDTRQGIGDIGRELQVGTVLEGSLSKAADQLRITVQLIDVQSQEHLWSTTYDRNFKDFFVIQSDVAARVAEVLKVRLLASERQQIEKISTENAEAIDLYLQGNYYWKQQSKADNAASIALFEKAVTIDPGFAEAHAALAQGYIHRSFYYDPGWEAKASSEITKALSLNPDLPEAILAQAMFLWTPAQQFQHERAVNGFKQARQLKPNLAQAHNKLAEVYVHVGLFDKAKVESKKALELDPLNSWGLWYGAVADLYAGQYEAALAELERVPRTFNQPFLAMRIANARFYLHRTNGALAGLASFTNKDNPELPSTRAIFFAAAHENGKAEKEIRLARDQETNYFGHFHHAAYNIGSAYALLGDESNAVHWLQKAADNGYPCYPRYKMDSNLKSLHDYPPFHVFLETMRKQHEEFKRKL